MDAYRLPVRRTVKLALADIVCIIFKMPILCLLTLAATILWEVIKKAEPGAISLGSMDPRTIFDGYFAGLVNTVIFAPLTVASYKILIIDNYHIWYSDIRLKSDLIIYLFVSILYSTASSCVLIFIGMISIHYHSHLGVFVQLGLWVSAVVLFYWGFRWSLIFPAIAVDQPDASLRWSARVTEGIVWRMVLVCVFPMTIAFLLVLPFLLAGFRTKLGVWSDGLSALASVVLTIFQAAILSRIYLWCRANRTSGDDVVLGVGPKPA